MVYSERQISGAPPRVSLSMARMWGNVTTGLCAGQNSWSPALLPLEKVLLAYAALQLIYGPRGFGGVPGERGDPRLCRIAFAGASIRDRRRHMAYGGGATRASRRRTPRRRTRTTLRRDQASFQRACVAGQRLVIKSREATTEVGLRCCLSAQSTASCAGRSRSAARANGRLAAWA